MSVTRLLQRLRAQPLRWRARIRRARGRYDRMTLTLLHRAQSTGDPDAFVEYLRFRRDLGQRLNPRFVPALQERIGRLPADRRWQAAALLSEIEADASAAARPPDAAMGIGVTSAAPRQVLWREDFRRALLAARSVCVVGNGGVLAGSGMGAEIDGADLVVRFNHWRGAGSDPRDLGTRVSAWVSAPGYGGPGSDQVDWVIVSGPDACYHLRDWSAFRQRLEAGRPVLTVPLGPWRRLVRILEAPPSAGVLTLAWLHELRGGWEGLIAVGIGTGVGGRYHHADPRASASARHAWTKEAALLQAWAYQGLELRRAPATAVAAAAAVAAPLLAP